MSDSSSKRFRDALTILELDQARWEAVLDTARDAIISIDTAGIITLFNRTAEEMFGYGSAEVLGQNVRMLMPPPYHDEHDGYLRNYQSTRIAKAIGLIRDVEARRKNGEVFPIELSVSEAQIDNQVIYTAIVRDVTERKRAELEHARWEAVLETARDPIVSVDRAGTITLFNRMAEEIFGYGPAEVLGENVRMLMPHPYHDEHDGYLRNYQHTHEAKAIGRIRYVEAKRKNGEVFPIELSVSEAQIGGQVIYTAIVRDVTERRQAEARVLELQKLAQERERLADIGAITAKIAHDLGNPLSGVSMQAQLVLERARGDPNQPLATVVKPAERLVSEVRRLEGLIREFLSFAREQRLDLQPIELPAFLRQVVDLWQPVATSRQIALALEDSASPHRIEADEAKLRRVLDNLLKNAIEAIDRGPGEVTIVVNPSGADQVRISVEDTGCGIPETLQVFRLFETTKAQGSGLGLAVSKQIVLAHGGDLLFNAREPRGTAFHVDLPVRRLSQ